MGSALIFLLKHGQIGDKYNIVGEREVDNLTLAHMIAEHVGSPLEYSMVDFHSSRPGHDLRYGLDGSKLATMGWTPVLNLDASLEQTVRWFLNNPEWL